MSIRNSDLIANQPKEELKVTVFDTEGNLISETEGWKAKLIFETMIGNRQSDLNKIRIINANNNYLKTLNKYKRTLETSVFPDHKELSRVIRLIEQVELKNNSIGKFENLKLEKERLEKEIKQFRLNIKEINKHSKKPKTNKNVSNKPILNMEIAS